MHKLDDSPWMTAHYFDLLKGFIRFRNVTNDVSVEAALVDLGIEDDSSAHRALEDARMTGEMLKAIFEHLDFELASSNSRMYTQTPRNARWSRMQSRIISAQKVVPKWQMLLDNFLAPKVSLDDPRKLAELEAYFESEMVKEQRPTSNPSTLV